MSQRIAIIDLGSNSARLIIVEIYQNRAYNLIYHQKETIRLSQDADKSRQLQPDAMERAMVLLQNFSNVCKLHQVTKILAVGTAALRNAENGSEFVRAVQQETGIVIKIISGETEAKLGYIGAINTLSVTDAVLFDLGGGSIELTLIKNRKAEKFISLPFGAVTLTERFNLQNKVSETQLNNLDKFITQQLDKIPWLKNLGIPLIGIGGTARAIGKMEQKRNNYPLLKLHNYRTSSIAFDLLWADVKAMSFDQRRKIPGLSNDRADIILSGLAIVKNLFSEVESTQLIVSSCGVREGLFLQYYLSQDGQTEALADPLIQSTHNTLLSYNANTDHAYHVAKLANQLFDDWQEALNLTSTDKALLQVAAVLHDVGISINYYDHARHSTYLIENARLFGLSHREQIMTSLIAGWHHGYSSKNSYTKIYSEFLDEENWQTARKLALLLALAESLDSTQRQSVENITTVFAKKETHLLLTTNQPIPIELQAIKKHSKWFKKETGFELIVKN
ncbi:exopolyphosphatase [Pelosinus sp. sgz500959]|uniref:exopolyphosphatase n=1 Tax=Pelosinus sp. sgz500959 TaxID=3242472 RepID=UPI0036729911